MSMFLSLVLTLPLWEENLRLENSFYSNSMKNSVGARKG